MTRRLAALFAVVALILGTACTPSPEEIIEDLRAKAEQGDAEAQYNLAVMYHEGQGLPALQVEAARWYRLAAEQGHGAAAWEIGTRYEDGNGTPQDNAEAEHWYQLAAERGNLDAQWLLADRADRAGHDETAKMWARRAIEQEAPVMTRDWMYTLIWLEGLDSTEDWCRTQAEAPSEPSVGAMDCLADIYQMRLSGLRDDPQEYCRVQTQAFMWANLAVGYTTPETDNYDRRIVARNQVQGQPRQQRPITRSRSPQGRNYWSRSPLRNRWWDNYDPPKKERNRFDEMMRELREKRELGENMTPQLEPYHRNDQGKVLLLANKSRKGYVKDWDVSGYPQCENVVTDGQRLSTEWDRRIASNVTVDNAAVPTVAASNNERAGDAVTRTTLQEAIVDGLVAASFRGTGGSTGDVIQVRVQKTAAAGSAQLVLSVPAGSLLRNNDPSVQDMVIQRVQGRSTGDGRYVEEATIVLDDNSPATYILSAYCADFDEDNPSGASRFTLDAPQGGVYRCIVDTGADLSIGAVQAAVWMHSNGLSYAQMNERFEITRADWNSGQTVFQTCAR